MKKIKSNLDGIRPKSKTFRFNVKGTESRRFHHAESTGGVDFLRFTTDRRWLLRRCVSCTIAVPNSWNLVLQNPQLWILYTLSLETYVLIPVIIKKYMYISDLGGMHTNNNKKRNQGHKILHGSAKAYIHRTHLHSTHTILSMNTTMKNYIVSNSPTPTKLRQQCN
jgi:hypothetical protein